MIATELWRSIKERVFLARTLLMPFEYIMKTPFHGAQTTLYCAINPIIGKDNGLYYSDCAEKIPSSLALKEEDQKRLWTISEQTVGLNKDIQDEAKKKQANKQRPVADRKQYRLEI